MAAFLMTASCVIVGVLIGAVGIGGVLLVPSLVVFERFSVHEAAATALFSFLFTGVLGGWLFRRRGSLDWRIAAPVCAGAFLLGFAGAAAGARLPAAPLTWIVAGILFGAGIYTFFSGTRGRPEGSERRPPGTAGPLLGIGALSGFGAGLSGAGGPLFSVPLMLAAGFEPLAAVGTGQVVQIASALSGSLGNASHGTIQYRIGLGIAAGQLLGTLIGVRIAHAAPGRALRFLTAALCIASAAGMAARAAFPAP